MSTPEEVKLAEDLESEETGGEVRIYDTTNDEAVIRSDSFYDLEERR